MAHRWHFFRAGGVDQVSIRSSDDLRALPELDQKLWVALAMPTRDLDLDPATLDLLDTDKDGRIRAPDIIAALRWVDETASDPDLIIKAGESLPLVGIKEGPVRAAARRMLSDLGKPDAGAITLGDVAEAVKAYATTKLNGDGVITPVSADEADLKQAIEEAIAGAGATPDRSGVPGLDQAHLDTFFADVDKRRAWLAAGEAVRPLGAATDAAADALAAVRARIDDYFARCGLAEFDPRAVAGLNGLDSDFAALGARALTTADPEMAKLPLARIEAGRPLPLQGGVNPAWRAALATFADACVTPLLGARASLDAAQFAELCAKLAPFEAWRASKPTTSADKLEPARLEALGTGGQRQALAALIAADKALEADYAAKASVEKLLRFQRDLGRILRNFVNFSDFYGKRDGAFQQGTLYLDGRAFKLVIGVGDAGKHGALAAMSSAYLAYCDLVRGADKKQIVVAVTNGDADNIFVGRNGVFYDRHGKDWDATVTKIIANPISLREAFWAPYKKLVRLIEEQVNKRAAEADAKANAKIEGAATKVATIDQRPATPAPAAAPADAAAAPGAAPAKKGLDIGIIAVISLAISAIVGVVVSLVAMLVGMGIWMPLGIVALLLVISGPSMVLAWMKLRQRNLGPILDANGWAVNTRARVNVAFGAALTDLAALPKHASRSIDDPFADKGRPWKLYIAGGTLLVLGASWYAGKLDRYLPGPAKSVKVLGKHAPAAPAETPEKPAADAPAPATK